MANKNKSKRKRNLKRKIASELRKKEACSTSDNIKNMNEIIKKPDSGTIFGVSQGAIDNKNAMSEKKEKNKNQKNQKNQKNHNSAYSSHMVQMEKNGLIVPDNANYEHLEYATGDPSVQESLPDHLQTQDKYDDSDVFIASPRTDVRPLTPLNELDRSNDQPVAMDDFPIIDGETPDSDQAPLMMAEKRMERQPTGIFRIPVHGVIVSDEYDEYSFDGRLVTPDAIIGALNFANINPQVRTIVMDYNSPGGDLFLGQEIVKIIRDIRKPVIAYVSQYACSQAYLYASAADRIVAARDAIVGSLGVMTGFMSAEERELVSFSQFAPKKNSRESSVRIGNELEELYHSTIAEGRNTTLDNVRNSFGEGEEIIASRALALGMIDEIKSRNDFYVDLTNMINFVDTGEEVIDQSRVGDVNIDNDETFEMFATKTIEVEVPVPVQNPVASSENDEQSVLLDTVGNATALLNDDKNNNNIIKNNILNDKNIDNKQGTYATINKKSAQSCDVNVSPSESRKESKDKKMPNDDNASYQELGDTEKTNQETIAAAATAAANATAEEMEKRQEQQKQDNVLEKISMNDLKQLLDSAVAEGVQKGEENILKRLEEKDIADKAAEKARQERILAIMNSEAGTLNPVAAKTLAEDETLASQSPEFIISLINKITPPDTQQAQETTSSQIVSSTASKDVDNNQIDNSNLEKEVAEAGAIAADPNAAIRVQLEEQARKELEEEAQANIRQQEIEQETSPLQAQLDAIQEKLDKAEQDKKEMYELFNQEIEDDSNVKAPMLEAMEVDAQNQPRVAAAAASSDPLSGARLKYMQGQKANAAAEISEDDHLLDLMKKFQKPDEKFDDQKAQALIYGANKCDEVFGPDNSSPINDSTLYKVGALKRKV